MKKTLPHCPNCAFDTRVKFLWETRDCKTDTYVREYECACGCRFEVEYAPTDVRILNSPKRSVTNYIRLKKKISP